MQSPSALILSAAVFFCLSPFSQGQDFEKPGSLSARDWWNDADWLRTDLWQVRDEVRVGEFTNHYVIDSVHGTFEAWSDQELLARLKELQAIHWLLAQGAARTGGQGAVEVATSKITVVEDLAKAPLATVLDVPRGARALIRRAGSFAREERRHGNYGSGGPVRGLLGANDRKRALAVKLEVDPYTDNALLQKELDRVALIEALPDFGVGLLIPGNGLFSLLETGKESRMMDAYLSAPADLFVENRKTLRNEIGIPETLTMDFLALPFTTPAQQTILARALAMAPTAKDRDLLVDLAAKSTSREEFDFYRRAAELLAWYQKEREPVAKLETFRWLPVAVSTSGKKILPFAVDYGGWCADCGGILSTFADMEGGDIVLVTGRLTERALRELKQRDVEVISIKS